MAYYIYQVTNTQNGKIYIGAHDGEITDDYLGSGRLISHALRKYGPEAFTKTILHTFNTAAEMYAKERELVNEEFVARKDTYNLAIGGVGGPRPNSGPPIGNENRKGKCVPYKARPKMTKALQEKQWWMGRRHTDEAKAKMRAAKAERRQKLDEYYKSLGQGWSKV